MGRRWTGGAAVLAVTLGGLVATAGPAAAAPAVRCDFDGDGIADLAIGVPGEDGRGAVNVQYAGGPGFLQEDWLPAGSAFGAALTCGDFDADGISDLAVAAPLAYDRQGKVFVYAGRDGSGLPTSATRMFSQGGAIPGEYEDDDLLGWSLAAGDVDDNGYDDLVVGVPGDRDAQDKDRPGSVVVVHGGWKGLRFDGTAEQLFGWTEADDGKEFHTPPAFGWSVAVGRFADGATIAVGAPYASPRMARHLPVVNQGGRVFTFDGTPVGVAPVGILDQTDGEIGPGAEEGDLFGWSLAAGDRDADGTDELAVGAPFEDVGDLRNAGQVTVFTDGPPQVYGQAVLGGVAEAGDSFGFSVAIGGGAGTGFGTPGELVIGAPGESVDDVPFAGAVSLVDAGKTVTGSGRLGMSVAVVGDEPVAGAPAAQCKSALLDGCLAGEVLLVASGPRLHQDTADPEVADEREPALTPMPYDDTPGEEVGKETPELGGEWFGWAVAS